MTLKQFFQLAGGAVVGLIFYKTPLPFILKWPLIIISALTGVMLAFVPVSGRPFSQWLLAFIRAVYSPTSFYWHPSPALEDAVSSPPPKVAGGSPLDKLEDQIFGRISDLFSHPAPSPVTSVPDSFRPASPTPPPEAVSPGSPTQTAYSKLQSTPPPPSITKPLPTAPPPPSPLEPPATMNSAPTRLTPIITHSPIAPSSIPTRTTSSMPTPSYPNLLAGLITLANDQPLDAAILEITNSATGIPARALRTNKLGQFQIATPLPNGTYIISVEKEGFAFDPVSVVAEGHIIQPIFIKAKA